MFYWPPRCCSRRWPIASRSAPAPIQAPTGVTPDLAPTPVQIPALTPAPIQARTLVRAGAKLAAACELIGGLAHSAVRFGSEADIRLESSQFGAWASAFSRKADARPHPS